MDKKSSRTHEVRALNGNAVYYDDEITIWDINPNCDPIKFKDVFEFKWKHASWFIIGGIIWLIIIFTFSFLNGYYNIKPKGTLNATTQKTVPNVRD